MKLPLWLGYMLLCAVPAVSQAAEPTSFKHDVKPILDSYCVGCHQPGGKGYEKSKLDLRSYEGVMKGTQYGSIVKPGDSFTSVLIQVVEGRVHSSIKMPYGMAGGLSKEAIATLRNWVDQGSKNN